MNKKSLFNRVFVKSPFDKEISLRVFDAYFEELRSRIINEKCLYIEEIGFFEIEHRRMTLLKDLKKGAKILLPPKDKIKFKPSDFVINSLKD